MADWKVVKSGYSEIGVEWNITNYDTYISYAPVFYLYYYVNSSDPYIEYSWNLVADGSSVSSGSTTLSTGGAFKGSKQIDSFSTHTISRGTGTKSLSLSLSFGDLYGGYGSGWSGSWSGTWYYTVPALASYTVSYNANGGSGAPSSQTKYHGQTLTLSSTKPTRSGYIFGGWSLKDYASKATWISGARYSNSSFTDGSSITMYAVWKKVQQIWLDVPDGVTIQDIKFRIPTGQTIGDIKFRYEPVYLTSSDGMRFVDSNGNYIIMEG